MEHFLCWRNVQFWTTLKGFRVSLFLHEKYTVVIHFKIIFTGWKVSVFVVILVPIFPRSHWILRDTKFLSVFSPNKGKYVQELLRTRTLLTQWFSPCKVIISLFFDAFYCFLAPARGVLRTLSNICNRIFYKNSLLLKSGS